MRKLTAPEIAKEVRDIKTRPWPHGDMLPVKNLYDGRFGCILRDRSADRPHVRPMLNEVGDERISVLQASANTVYPSLQAMVEAGWVPD
jgi:hypothetical protein